MSSIQHESNFNNAKRKEKKIIIIGAGISGLACASHLNELGFENVTVLEARDRVGGRIFTKYFDSNCIEIGAEWIHGQEGNIIYHYANANDLVNNELSFEMFSPNELINLSSREKTLAFKLFKYIYQKNENFPDDFRSGTFQDYFDQSFVQFLKEENLQQNSDLLNSLHQAYNFVCKLHCEINGCAELGHLSGTLLKNYRECGGNSHVEPKKGYFSILKLFLNRIPQEWIVKNKHVCKIDWSFYTEHDKHRIPKKIEVLCHDGDSYLADHVIVTLPLGYLKKHSDSIFCPPLSEMKQTAIKALGFDVVNKIYLEFEHPFWKKPDIFLVMWKKSFDEAFVTNSNHNKQLIWIKSISRFAYSANHPNMLCLWCSGENANAVELPSDEDAIEACKKLVELVLGKTISRPTRIFRSLWGSDPYTLGSYSFLSTDCDKKNVSNHDLAQPEYVRLENSEYPALMFAGEATHSFFYSTVHGACETGFREANRLSLFYRNEQHDKDFECVECHTSKIPRNLFSNMNLFQNIRVGIIGAGLSGLACALYLSNTNFLNFSVLEAQDKIGGRISTIEHDGNCLELGAQWIHGVENELYNFSEMHSLFAVNSTTVDEGKGKFFTSSGKAIKHCDVEEVKSLVNNAKCLLESGNYDMDKIVSADEFFNTAYRTKCDDASDPEIKKGIFDWCMKFEIIDNGCNYLSTIAVQCYTDWEECSDELYHISLNTNFSSLTEEITNQLPEGVLHLNTPVKNINFNQNFNYECYDDIKDRSKHDYPVAVTFESGESMYFDSIVVTASIGFLKENCDTFFTPLLPKNKVEALKNIEFGVVNKIFLVYDNPFWDRDDEGFQLVWIKEMTSECRKLLEEHPWIAGITGFDIVPGKSILLGWIGGEQAKLFEQVPKEEIGRICTILLRNFLNDSNIPEPLDVFRSCWYSNAYIKGAYSSRTLDFYKCNSSLHDIKSPICSTYVTKSGKKLSWPILLFAGEATDENSFSAVHGAFRSGLTAAQTILKACSEVKVYEEIERHCY